MKLKLLLATVAVGISAAAQTSFYAPVLQAVEDNNLTLVAARGRLEARRAEGSTGLAPANPEVELGYLWSSPDIGHRRDVSISQEFDFPTVYSHRRAISRSTTNIAEAEYMVERQNILLEARKLYARIIYANSLARLRSEECANARAIHSAYQRMYAGGLATRLECDRAALAYAAAEAAAEDAETELNQTKEALTRRLNAGDILTDSIPTFPHMAVPASLDSVWEEAQRRDPRISLARLRNADAHRHVSLAKAEGLPKFSIGWMGEFVHGSNFHGITLGLSLPLWENRGRVKSARASLASSQSELADIQSNLYADLTAAYGRALSAQRTTGIYTRVLESSDSTELLARALAEGEITQIQYLEALADIYQARASLLEAQLKLALAMAELEAYTVN